MERPAEMPDQVAEVLIIPDRRVDHVFAYRPWQQIFIDSPELLDAAGMREALNYWRVGLA